MTKPKAPVRSGKAAPKSFASENATPAQRPIRSFQGGAKAVGSFVPKLTQKAFEKYGFSAATMLTDWAAIVGPDLAALTLPERLKWPRGVEIYGDIDEPEQRGRPGATLMLKVDPARALDVQYKGTQIIERINAYFGYRAVSELRLIQSPINSKAGLQALTLEAKPVPPIDMPAEIDAVRDDSLRAALERMAAGIGQRLAKRRKTAL